jgi:hypothetical protein
MVDNSTGVLMIAKVRIEVNLDCVETMSFLSAHTSFTIESGNSAGYPELNRTRFGYRVEKNTGLVARMISNPDPNRRLLILQLFEIFSLCQTNVGIQTLIWFCLSIFHLKVTHRNKNTTLFSCFSRFKIIKINFSFVLVLPIVSMNTLRRQPASISILEDEGVRSSS